MPDGLPQTLVVYLKRCLHKDPKQRIPDMAAMRLALEGALDTAAPHATTMPPARRTERALVWGSAAIAVVSLALLRSRFGHGPQPFSSPRSA